jgi:DNA-binding transcriptional regulator LsrR (DeoR family)
MPVPSKLPDLAILKELYFEERLTLHAIGARYGTSRQAVHERLRRAGVRTNLRWRVILDRKDLSEMYLTKGLGTSEIALALNVSPQKVREQLRRHGLKRPLRFEHLASKHTRQEIEELYVHRGLTQAKTAKALGMSVPLLQRLLVHFGITFRHQALSPSYRNRVNAAAGSVMS